MYYSNKLIKCFEDMKKTYMKNIMIDDRKIENKFAKSST